ncbi:hypothetical protein GCM10007049_09670 [Echinicola pacifica]|uniref:Uncharacterized protein n=1 Tax=Echinicola pacifica TaxID=346377 RepID=A0A918PQI9_9BACT|nr:hypothetical protein [Echinicola pacifica]GGZ19357.1 hypothetical protein GCM10007049_09670 [Echinicola pacifica]
MTIKELERLQKNYKSNLGRDQTNSIWFDRQTLEKLLEKTDPKTGGLKLYFAEYDAEYVEAYGLDNEIKGHIGKMTIVLAASNNNEDPENDDDVDNGGNICPPNCN